MALTFVGPRKCLCILIRNQRKETNYLCYKRRRYTTRKGFIHALASLDHGFWNRRKAHHASREKEVGNEPGTWTIKNSILNEVEEQRRYDGTLSV